MRFQRLNGANPKTLYILFRDKQVVLLIIKYGAVNYLVDMLVSQYALMQNEAIMSLTILTKICPVESEELLIKAGFGRNMCEFFSHAHSLDVHIILNALSLLDSLLQSGNSKIHPGKKESLFDMRSAD